MSEKLKSCPFCGSESELFHNTDSDYQQHWYWTVECKNTECGECHNTERGAINHWNTRAADKPTKPFNPHSPDCEQGW